MSEVGPDRREDFGISTDTDMKGLERPEANIISDLSQLDSGRAHLKAVIFPFQMESFSFLEEFAKIFCYFTSATSKRNTGTANIFWLVPRVKHKQILFRLPSHRFCQRHQASAAEPTAEMGAQILLTNSIQLCLPPE